MIGLEQCSVRRGGTTAYLELFFTFSSLLRFLVFKSLRWVALYMCADETFAAYEKTAKLMKVARTGEKLTRQEFARLLKLLGASEGRDASSVVSTSINFLLRPDVSAVAGACLALWPPERQEASSH